MDIYIISNTSYGDGGEHINYVTLDIDDAINYAMSIKDKHLHGDEDRDDWGKDDWEDSSFLDFFQETKREFYDSLKTETYDERTVNRSFGSAYVRRWRTRWEAVEIFQINVEDPVFCDNCGKTGVPLIEHNELLGGWHECEGCSQIGANPKQHRWDCINGTRHGGYAWRHRFKYQRCKLKSKKDLPVCICGIDNGCGLYKSRGLLKSFFDNLFHRN